jgi:hypothetical protein
MNGIERRVWARIGVLETATIGVHVQQYCFLRHGPRGEDIGTRRPGKGLARGG